MNLKNSRTNRAAVGGRAMSGGDGYQARVAAWFCVQILAEQSAATAWNLSSGETFELVETHTEKPVDDILIQTSLQQNLYISVKIQVDNQRGENSDFAGFISQAVCQFAGSQAKGETNNRILLITTSKSSQKIREDLRNILVRVRNSPHRLLTELPKNAAETEVWETFTTHTNSFWTKKLGGVPSDEQIRRFAETIWIEVLDVEASKSDELSSLSLLNSLLVGGNEQGEAAWKFLIQHCQHLQTQSGSANRRLLRDELTRLGLCLKATPSFAADIEKLKKISQKNLLLARDLSVIKVGEKEIKINRRVKNVLMNAAESGSLIITGDAGAGKSGVLYEFVSDLAMSEKDFVFLAVDKIEATSRTTLRGELEQLEHDFTQILNEWTGNEPAFLVIDALDASRDAEKYRFFNKLVEEIIVLGGRWRVIVSIRRFDLRYNQTLNKLFAGQPVEGYALQEFSRLCHINIPDLSGEEWVQIVPQHPDFGTLCVNSNNDLRKLLCLPFNLKLVGELFGAGVRLEELNPFHAQIELLEKYWQVRVSADDHNGNGCESALIKAVETMVQNRQMQISRREILMATDDGTLREILHRGILTEQRQSTNGRIGDGVIAFPHHVLFDYAVARLILRGTAESLRQRLEQDKQLVLAIRPSILLHFQYELLKGEEDFWEQVFRTFRSEKIPAIGKLIGISVAVTVAKNADFFKSFFEKLNGISLEEKKIGKQILAHIGNELRYRSGIDSDENPFSANTRLWLDFLETLSMNFSPETANRARFILWDFMNRAGAIAPELFSQVAAISRKLLDFALTLPYQDLFLVTSAITFVCRTFAADPNESIKSLRPILESSRVCEYGHRELRFFADEIEIICKIRPAFIGEIYLAAFTNDDRSEEATNMSFSRILGLSSTRRQDFNGMQMELRSKFGQFLEQSRLIATHTLIKIFDYFVEEAYSRELEERKEWLTLCGLESGETEVNRRSETFTFNKKEATIKRDFSERWHNGTNYRNEETLNLLGTFQNYLEKLGESEDESLEPILEYLIEYNQNAVFWRNIIALGTKFPNSFGRKIRELAWALPILKNEDTYRPIAEYLRANYSLFTTDERKLAEKAILSLPKSVHEIEKNNLIYLRNYLLNSLDENLVETARAKKIIGEIKRQSEDRGEQSGYGNFEHFPLAEESLPERETSLGMSVTVFEKDLLVPIKSFLETHLNASPDIDAIEMLLPTIQNLYGALTAPEKVVEISENLTEQGWLYLSKFCIKTVENNDLPAHPKIFNLLKEILLACSDHPQPDKIEAVGIEDYHLSEFSFIRGNAGRGLVRLARFAGLQFEQNVLDRIRDLALKDSVHSVRYHTAVVILSLHDTASNLMWQIIEDICFNESDLAVLKGVTEYVLRRLSPKYPDNAYKFNKAIFERLKTDDEAKEIRKNCLHVFMHLAFLFGHAEAKEILNYYINQPEKHHDEMWQMVSTAGNSISEGIGEPYNQEKNRIRRASFEILEKICRAAHDTFQKVSLPLLEQDFALWTEADKENYKHHHQLINQIALKIYFASGAERHHQYSSPHNEHKIPETDEEKALFWSESRAVLNTLAETGFADVTHRLVETLEFLFPYAPRDIFLIFGEAVKHGRREDYQYESMAISHIVGLVERVFGEFPHLLKDDSECQETMIEVLDTFVEAFGDVALKLTYRLNEIYR